MFLLDFLNIHKTMTNIVLRATYCKRIRKSLANVPLNIVIVVLSLQTKYILQKVQKIHYDTSTPNGVTEYFENSCYSQMFSFVRTRFAWIFVVSRLYPAIDTVFDNVFVIYVVLRWTELINLLTAKNPTYSQQRVGKTFVHVIRLCVRTRCEIHARDPKLKLKSNPIPRPSNLETRETTSR